MITTIYKCDRCGHEQPTNVQFWILRVEAQPSGLGASSWARDMHVCRPCLEFFGVHDQKSEVREQSPPTLEELIVEIVRREVGA